MAKYIIKDHERGHRKPLSEKSKTITCSYRIPEHIQKMFNKKCMYSNMKYGEKIREFIKNFLEETIDFKESK